MSSEATPWASHFVEYGDETTDDLCILGPSPNFRDICELSRCYNGDRDKEMEAANAELIVRAVNNHERLLEVCKWASERLGGFCEGSYESTIAARLQAAIAAAEGGES